MLKFFLRFYIGVSFALVISSFLALLAIENQYNIAVARDYARMTKAVQTVLYAKLDATDQAHWSEILTAAEKEYLFDISLSHKSTIPYELQLKLNDRGVLAIVHSGFIEDNVSIYYPSPSSQYVLELQPAKNFNRAYNHLFIVVLIFVLGGFALTVLMLAWPIIKHINKLVAASSAIGQGDFSIKTDESAPAPLNKLAGAINSMSGKIHNLISEREVLTGAASHEFRTPLTRLRFALDLAQRIEDPQQLQEHVKSMTEDVQQLEELISELLAYSKFSYHVTSLETQPIILVELFDHVREKLQPLRPDIAIRIQCDPDILIHACNASLSRALENLVRNAQKYGDTSIELTATPCGEERVVIQVTDDGDGISEHERSAVLQPFYRIENSRNRETGGSGLGLAIVDHIVSLHHGVLSIGENGQKGTVVQIELPKMAADN